MKKESPTSLIRLVLNHPDLFYPQDWYYSEDFAYEPAVNIKSAASIARMFVAFAPDFDASPEPESVSWLRYAYWWTSDKDNSGNRVYVGGWGLGRKKGLQVHRHLKDPCVYSLSSDELWWLK